MAADIKWFTNAKVNIVKKLYRQTSCKKGDKTAIILNQMIQMKKLCIFRIMNCTTCKMANVLKEQGIQKESFVFTANDS
jgi:acetyl-CoA synthetase